MEALTFIIIPVGSKSKSLDQCLSSVIRFTPEPHEIILATADIGKKKRKRVKKHFESPRQQDDTSLFRWEKLRQKLQL